MYLSIYLSIYNLSMYLSFTYSCLFLYLYVYLAGFYNLELNIVCFANGFDWTLDTVGWLES
jgi:hypothetical protein